MDDDLKWWEDNLWWWHRDTCNETYDIVSFKEMRDSQYTDKMVELFWWHQKAKTKGCQERCLEWIRLKWVDRCCCCFYVRTGAKLIIGTDILAMVMMFLQSFMFFFLDKPFYWAYSFVLMKSEMSFSQLIKLPHAYIVYFFFSLIFILIGVTLKVIFGVTTLWF